jgi:hypothetical protein
MAVPALLIAAAEAFCSIRRCPIHQSGMGARSRPGIIAKTRVGSIQVGFPGYGDDLISLWHVAMKD